MNSIIQDLERAELARLQDVRGAAIPEFRPGDTVRVNVRIREGERERVQAFEGVCIARSGAGVNESFTVRKISFGEGVERLFPVQSPALESIEVKRRGVVRRAKLYYLRGRRGKSARIVERPLGRSPQAKTGFERSIDSALPSETDDARASFSTMLTALQQIRALKGAAEGQGVRVALAKALSDMPTAPVADASRSDAYELALTIGEHLCPLMFSYDDGVADSARLCLMRAGAIIENKPAGHSEAEIAAVLRHLEVAVVFQLSIKHRQNAADVILRARDCVFAAIKRPGIDDDHPVRVKLLLEDMSETIVQTLREARLGPCGDTTIKEMVDGDANDLGGKLVTIVADGQEVYRTSLRRDAELVFVL